MDPILPAIPPVRPRVVYQGDERPLDDIVAELLADDVRGVVELVGVLGCGKTTALALLAARFADNPALALVDSPTVEELESLPTEQLCIVGSTWSIKRPALRLHLAAWGADQFIEYLLEVQPGACRTIMLRLGAAARRGWSPYLATILVDRFLANEQAHDPRRELYGYVCERLDSEQLTAAREFCLALLLPKANRRAIDAFHAWRDCRIPASVKYSLLSHELVLPYLAADALVDAVVARSGLLPDSVPPELMEVAGPRCRNTPEAVASLRQALDDPQLRSCHPTLASLLAAADPAWAPAPAVSLRHHFTRASFQSVDWPRVDLRQANLFLANFADAYLEFARFSGADLRQANFYGANVHAADLMRTNAQGGLFTAANLSQANLTNGNFIDAEFVAANLSEAQLNRANLCGAKLIAANLSGADLSSAIITQAKLDEADFTAANLRNANLYGADLRSATLQHATMEQARLSTANLEDVALPEANFRGADLRHARLTGSQLRDAKFYGANLSGAGLAEIDWEGADLRSANLEGATFHMGSSRSGLVNSPIALEGNMTGFYNDDFEDRSYKRPEEIRKANLRGADLRGAKLGNINFYLVDLRGAKLDPDQLRHARNCGAILDDVAAA